MCIAEDTGTEDVGAEDTGAEETGSEETASEEEFAAEELSEDVSSDDCSSLELSSLETIEEVGKLSSLEVVSFELVEEGVPSVEFVPFSAVPQAGRETTKSTAISTDKIKTKAFLHIKKFSDPNDIS